MKLIHCADIHLGSKLTSKFPKEKSDERKSELLSTFARMVDYARDNDINVILLSGDVFDKDKPAIKDKNFFYKAVKNNPDIDFLYLNGNHDKEGSYTVDDIPNLKTFNKQDFTSYTYGDIVISGIEMCKENAQGFYSKLALDKEKMNIVMLHGDVSDSSGMDKVKISELKGKGIDYLALGHIHSYKTGRIDDRGEYAFPGCLEPRGFDECGEKGFIVLDVTNRVTHTFVPFASRTIIELPVIVTGAADLYEVRQKVMSAAKSIDRKNILLVQLEGELSVEADIDEKDIENALSDYYFVHVKNKCGVMVDVNDYKDDRSLIGEFIRGVDSKDCDLQRKQELLTLGLRLLNGKEVD